LRRLLGKENEYAMNTGWKIDADEINAKLLGQSEERNSSSDV